MQRIATFAISLLSLLALTSAYGVKHYNRDRQAARTISWKGYDWTTVTSGANTQKPGPNRWSNSASNIWIDAAGYMHLAATLVDGTFFCPELYTTTKLGFGNYTWTVQGVIESNVVLGLFPYTSGLEGPDGTEEIDIELSTWGYDDVDHAENLSYTIFPNNTGSPTTGVPYGGISQKEHMWFMGPKGANLSTTHSFNWTSTAVYFKAWDSSSKLIHSYDTRAQTTSPITDIPQLPVPLHMNLWIYRKFYTGKLPTTSVEWVIKDFKYVKNC